MNVFIDGRDLVKGQTTGIARFLQTILACIIPAKKEWKYFLLLNQHGVYEPSFDNLEILRVNETSTLFVDQVVLPRLLKKTAADIFFSPYYKCPLFTKTKTVITIHDLINFVTDDKKSLKNRLFLFWQSILARSASMVVTVSENSAADISRLLRIPTNKLQVLTNFNSVSAIFKPENQDMIAAMREKYGIKGQYILYVGNSKKHKNLERLIKAYEALPNETLKNFGLVLAGVNPGDIEMSLKERCKIIEHIEDACLPALYTGATIFVFPSLYEGFGIPPLEAMACGTPVITSNLTSLPEVVGDAAYTVDPYSVEAISNAMVRVINDTGLRNDLTAKGFKRAALFSTARSNQAFLTMFEQL